MGNSKSILEMSSQEAEAFFLKNESYHNIPLPLYFSFENLLNKLSKSIEKNRENINSYFKIDEAKRKDNINYIMEIKMGNFLTALYN